MTDEQPLFSSPEEYLRLAQESKLPQPDIFKDSAKELIDRSITYSDYQTYTFAELMREITQSDLQENLGRLHADYLRKTQDEQQ